MKNIRGLVTYDGAEIELKTWKKLEKKYGKKKVRQAADKTACGCAQCTKNLLEVKYNQCRKE